MADETPTEFVADETGLRSLYDAVHPLAANKAIPRLEKHSRHFIALSPFLCIASSDPAGPADVSPRGDAPGFVKVLDDQTLLIPDRIGNNRLDTSANIANNAHIGLLFLIPGVTETLRVNGQARTLDVDQVVVCAGQEPNAALAVELASAPIETHIIGGAHEASQLDALRAIEHGTRVALQL